MLLIGKRRPLIELHRLAWSGLAALRPADAATLKGARKALGDRGEREAYFYLRRAGYTVVARQWRAPNLNGELDLIAWHGDTLCFVEVKTRSAQDRYAPAYRMNPKKQTMLRRMAHAYVNGLPWRNDAHELPAMRFDFIAVVQSGSEWIVEHRQNVFASED